MRVMSFGLILAIAALALLNATTGVGDDPAHPVADRAFARKSGKDF